MYNKNNSNDWRLRIRKHGCQKEINILKVLNEKNDQPRILHPVKISFRNYSEKKTFSEEKKLADSLKQLPIIHASCSCLGQLISSLKMGRFCYQQNMAKAMDVTSVIMLHKTITSGLLADSLYWILDLHTLKKQAAILERPLWQVMQGSLWPTVSKKLRLSVQQDKKK